ncbi:MAG: metallophosphoesterase family protein [Nitrososphaerota archaeon]|nr:metallophosphoesterase family protein [Candidatus Calditenuis fumarioli]
MRVLQISDVHGSMRAASAASELARREGVELIVVAGDLTTFGTVEEVRRVLTILSSSGIQVLYVPGNCDPPELLRSDVGLDGVTNLHGRTVTVGGLRVGGVGGGLAGGPKSWIDLTEQQIGEVLDRVGKVDLLVSHTPPHGTSADFLGGAHVGSLTVREYCERSEPLAVSCGHIHEARSVSKLGKTTVVNAGPAKSGNAAILEISGQEVRAELIRL